MRYIFKFPDIGEGLDEGTIAEWYVEKGQAVEMGESLVKMETDKVVTDIPSPKTGMIANIFGKVGETIHVGDPLVEFDIQGIDGEEAITEAAKPDFEPVEEGAGVVGTLEVADNSAFLPATEEMNTETLTKSSPGTEKHKSLATPVARVMAKELNVDINDITGTGPVGRVMKNDIQKHYQQRHKHFEAKSGQDTTPKAEARVEIQALSQIRKAIARNMIQSKHNAAHMTVFDEIEVSELIRIRNKYKEIFSRQEIKLSYLPFVLKATALALKEHPTLNSEMNLEGGQLILKKYYNIGIAVDTDEGLLVPVIHDVDLLSIKELAQKVNQIANKSRNRELGMDDMKDGTFTITNFGSIGGQFAVPVINYPQAGILGVGRMVQKPVVKDNAIVPGTMLPLSLSVDHRIVDGGEVSRFLNKIMEYLNDPVSLLMG
ncbi:MAG: 2-oxo acid dehydrogenase subunit E2 [Bacteroidetes bacterium]|jgi:pyruvate dehydrogenase E2 component (dihydrolipoamide acetyltransferase)|nr:2-oxo acid dehydrogenase subunit E2 [Bacteroidota bacterium]MBT3749494.1 2-oxo acid dehydrogenase subunit E2 [Bacteroidota bacterium]MBT4400233.1 2-oxo acid dehydrogenase subunit E2 [Bacteroidota bacterium]MBT4409255.1 2-oxo acid dehydrogenase subunit E2 [Bacteroidota bacterium]MBT7092735.1 2-oxo acid dehydrogenase subunit E2 [Bacteroidota bacterium]